MKGEKVKSFVEDLLLYLRRVWLDGDIPRELWNMYSHRGVTTNNDAESLNSKLGGKSKLKSHPNPYLLVDKMKTQFQISRDQQLVQLVQNTKKRQKTATKNLEKRRKELMKDLAKGHIVIWPIAT